MLRKNNQENTKEIDNLIDSLKLERARLVTFYIERQDRTIIKNQEAKLTELQKKLKNISDLHNIELSAEVAGLLEKPNRREILEVWEKYREKKDKDDTTVTIADITTDDFSNQSIISKNLESKELSLETNFKKDFLKGCSSTPFSSKQISSKESLEHFRKKLEDEDFGFLEQDKPVEFVKNQLSFEIKKEVLDSYFSNPQNIAELNKSIQKRRRNSEYNQ